MIGHAFTPVRVPAMMLVLGAAIAASAAGAAAQTEDERRVAEQPLATREGLLALATRLDATRVSQTDAELLARIRARLEDGDFRPGDAVLLEVQEEPALTDTFRVGPQRDLVLPPPATGNLSLRGVLRSEFEDVVARHVARFVHDPVVRAKPLLRLSIQGEVVRAGIHVVPADAVLADALMAAGGTTRDADMKKLRIERDGKPIWKGQELQRAMAAGQTVDEALLRNGDQIVVARRREMGLEQNLRFLWVVVSLVGGIYGLSRAF